MLETGPRGMTWMGRILPPDSRIGAIDALMIPPVGLPEDAWARVPSPIQAPTRHGIEDYVRQMTIRSVMQMDLEELNKLRKAQEKKD